MLALPDEAVQTPGSCDPDGTNNAASATATCAYVAAPAAGSYGDPALSPEDAVNILGLVYEHTQSVGT